MKHLLTLIIFCLSIFTSYQLTAQNMSDYDPEKRDTVRYYAILGSETHSGSECGHYRSSGPKPTFRLVIVDLELDKVPTAETPRMSYQSSIKTEILKPYRKSHNFKFKKVGGGKLNPDWEIHVPCYVEEATFTIDLKYKNKGRVKPLNINSKGNKNQLTLSVDFVNQKVYSLDKGKTLLGSFNKTLRATGKKQAMADKANIKLRIE